MERTLVNGNKALAEKLSVSTKTIYNWKKSGILESSIVANFGRTIIYDLDKVFDCLQYHTVKPGRRAAI